VPDWVVAAGQQTVAPGRNDVVLFDRETVHYLTADRVNERHRFAFRLVDGLSRGEAHYGIGYNPDDSRIIHASAWIIPADGGRPRSFGQSDFRDVASSNHVIWTHNRGLIFDGSPFVQAGGTMVCEIEVEFSGVSEVQHSFAPAIYTERESFEVTPAAGSQLTWRATSPALPQPTPGAAPGSLQWEKGPLPRPSAIDRPRSFLPNPEMIFVRAEVADQPLTWNGLSRQLSTVVEPQMTLTPMLRAKAQEIAGTNSDRWTRIRALAEFVQRQIVYLSLTDDTDRWAGCRPHLPTEVLTNRYGDCKDKSALLLTLLRAIGEDGRMLLVTLGDPRSVSPDWPQLHFNHAIVAIQSRGEAPPDWPRVDGGALGELVVFDPTDTTCPLGVLTGLDQKGWVLLLDPKDGALLQLPEAKGPAHFQATQAVVTLSAEGDATAIIDSDMHGLLASASYARREALRKDRMTESLTAQIRESVPLVHDLVWEDRWAPAPATYHLHTEFKAEGYGRRLGLDLLAVSPELGSGLANFPEWRTGREGISWLWTGALRRQTTIKLPPGYKVEELPENWDRVGPTISSHLAYRTAGNEVSYDMEFTLQPGFYDRARYEVIRKFIVKFRDAERRPILLRRIKPASSERSS
jgi:hypothetical protein